MNLDTRRLQSRLIAQYYETAAVGWLHPKTLHWTKVVNQGGLWRWLRTDRGIRNRIVRNPPLHVYQTLLRFKTRGAPRGWKSNGYLLGGPVLFELDALDKTEPLNLWKLVDTLPQVEDLVDFMKDRGDYRLTRLTFSGFRGVHVVFEKSSSFEKPITLDARKRAADPLKSLIKTRRQLARAVGYHCKGWDWRVSEDIWRVVRVPFSLHGGSSLRAIPLNRTFKEYPLGEQLREASPFSFSEPLNIRIRRTVPLFAFLDGEYYGPFRKEWYTRLPVAVALHLIWGGFAVPREQGPKQISKWFDRGWQLMIRKEWKTMSSDAHVSEVMTS